MADSPTGYPALLDALHETVAPGGLVAAARGHVVASVATLPVDGGELSRFGAAWTVDPGAERADDRFRLGLLRLHTDLLRRTLAHALAHLEGRSAEGTTLLSRQLIQGALADIAVDIYECEAMWSAPGRETPWDRWLVSQRLVGIGRRLLDLLGASGFLADGPAADLYLAEVTGNVYLHPGTENEDA